MPQLSYSVLVVSLVRLLHSHILLIQHPTVIHGPRPSSLSSPSPASAPLALALALAARPEHQTPQSTLFPAIPQSHGTGLIDQHPSTSTSASTARATVTLLPRSPSFQSPHCCDTFYSDRCCLTCISNPHLPVVSTLTVLSIAAQPHRRLSFPVSICSHPRRSPLAAPSLNSTWETPHLTTHTPTTTHCSLPSPDGSQVSRLYLVLNSRVV